MNPKSVQQIGKKFAKWCNQQIEEIGLGKATGTPGSGSGKIKGDNYNNLDFMFEFKSQRNPSWAGNIKQARDQAIKGNFNKDKWVMVQRDSDTPQENPQAFAILDYIEFLKLLKRNNEPLIKSPDKELRWLLQRSIETNKQIIKLIEE